MESMLPLVYASLRRAADWKSSVLVDLDRRFLTQTQYTLYNYLFISLFVLPLTFIDLCPVRWIPTIKGSLLVFIGPRAILSHLSTMRCFSPVT